MGLLGINVDEIPLRSRGIGFAVFLSIALLPTAFAAWLFYRFARDRLYASETAA
ncbi:hypothetical protein [Burkholderia stagnalis]|uniref:hypothetical protein n=1 Tax=Burkholderia stagnalis TaxID=1503054 RepID=UPI000B3225F0|nr:hypothetical protein [Burkholderia stagnalis]